MDASRIAIEAAMQPGDPAVVKTLEEALALARSGRRVGMAMVAIQADGSMGFGIASPNLPGLYFGCDELKGHLATMMKKRGSSGIVPVRGGLS